MQIDQIELLTAEQVAKAFKVERDTIYKWVARGILPYYQLTEGEPYQINKNSLDSGKSKKGKGTVRFLLADVQEFLRERRIEQQKKGRVTS